MTESLPPSSAKKPFWKRPWPYVVAGLLLGLALVPVALVYQSLHGHGRVEFHFEPVSPERYPERRIVNLTRESAARLPGDIPQTLDRAKVLGSASISVGDKEREELLRGFGVNMENPGWNYTLIRYDGTIFSYVLRGE